MSWPPLPLPLPPPPVPPVPPVDVCAQAKCGYCGLYGQLGPCRGCGAPNQPMFTQNRREIGLGEAMRIGVTDKGLAWVAAMRQAQQELAAVWREPFEGYQGLEYYDWMGRISKATRVCAALERQLNPSQE